MTRSEFGTRDKIQDKKRESCDASTVKRDVANLDGGSTRERLMRESDEKGVKTGDMRAKI